MNHRSPFRICGLAVLSIISLAGAFTVSAQLPEKDARYEAPRTLNTPRRFIELKSRADWQRESAAIRTHILVSCGLHPLPPKSPLNPQITGRREMDGYVLETVSLETYPGFFLVGNLYRPLNKGKGPFPAVLNPHGHWAEGRLVDSELGSARARCITQARMGMVAFAYDMVGYNDTMQFSTAKGDMGKHRVYGTRPEDQLWGLSMMGLQLWNSIRVVDFLGSLPDVDPKRIGCTGESGGGTQTFMLAAVDDRIKVTVPCVMVSHSMQGGCTCENAPGLRVNYSNMEIAASAAPRPQLLVAATGDWTKKTMDVEGPAVESVYKLLKADRSLRYVIFDFPHNYNLTSRQAVYPWLGQHLLKKPDTNSFVEQSYQKLEARDLLMWPDGKRPAQALSYEAFLTAQKTLARSLMDDCLTSKAGEYQNRYQPVWQHSLQLDLCDKDDLSVEQEEAEAISKSVTLGRNGKGDRIPLLIFHPSSKPTGKVVVIASPNGWQNLSDGSGRPSGLAASLVQRGNVVVIPELFQTGRLYQKSVASQRNYFTNFFTTYNRTDAQERAQDLVTTMTYARSLGKKVALCGLDRAGLWAMLAAPAADIFVTDAQSFNSRNEQLLLADDLFFPNLQRLGGFDGIIALAAPKPALVHNTGNQFSTKVTKHVYGTGARTLKLEENRLDDLALVTWISAQ